jgi:hypothetical protein
MGRKKFGTGFVINKVFSLVLLKYCVMKKFIIGIIYNLYHKGPGSAGGIPGSPG